MSGAFLQCSNCRKVLFAAEFEQNLRVCQHCGHHHRLSARDRIRITYDEGSFQELHANLRSENPLQFPEYEEKKASAEQKTGSFDSIICGVATLSGMPVATAVSDFAFMGGSMGSVAGEKIALTLELALQERMPAVIFTTSGGARMQEGMLSLMQMAKTTAAAGACRENGIPYIGVFTDPTMAGVLASYASLADVIIAEPKAMVGLAGGRVAKQAGGGKAPDDFQTTEYVFRNGFIDIVSPRKELKAILTNVVRALGAHLREVA